VAELNPVIVTWCCGPLAGLTQNAVKDPRVLVETDDVAAVIIGASLKGANRYDAIIIDLYVGPGADTEPHYDPFYGSLALSTTADALSAGGVFAVWGENPDAAFEKRLVAAGFTFERLRPGRGGLRHVVYVARKR
jgi:spermidine synthase